MVNSVHYYTYIYKHWQIFGRILNWDSTNLLQSFIFLAESTPVHYTPVRQQLAEFGRLVSHADNITASRGCLPMLLRSLELVSKVPVLLAPWWIRQLLRWEFRVGLQRNRLLVPLWIRHYCKVFEWSREPFLGDLAATASVRVCLRNELLHDGFWGLGLSAGRPGVLVAVVQTLDR